MSNTSKAIHVSGKRKRAVARATIKPGKGKIRVNAILLEHYEPALARAKLKEPLIIAGDLADKVDISVNIMGGGQSSQAGAARLAISRALVRFYAKDKMLEKTLLEYDRQLLVADVRRKESSKPNSHGQARAKRQKSYR
ncbi:MAG: 30S ribosomal protein S9 [DPANN group archaeon]|nr:30S ribosomal protein S9 [DPANN group archaeon]